MAGFDDDPFFSENTEGFRADVRYDDQDDAPSSLPILWLTLAAVLLPFFDLTAELLCQGRCGVLSPLRFLLVVPVLMIIGLALRSAFENYTSRNTLLICSILAVIPAAYLLTMSRGGGDTGALERRLAESEAARSELEAQVDLLSAEIGALSLAPTGPTAEEIREIAVQEARIVFANQGALPPIGAVEDVPAVVDLDAPALEEAPILGVSARNALMSVGERLAERGPYVHQPRVVPQLDAEMQAVAERLGLNRQQRAALAQNEERQTCIRTRLAERGPILTVRHRTNRQAYRSYLNGCFT